MTNQPLHSWNVAPPEAIAIQRELRDKVLLTPLDGDIQTIAGADISFNKYSDVLYAAIVVLSFPALETIDEVGVVATSTFPYVPGLLSFREAPPLLEAWKKLRTRPDLLVCDGQGIAHPRRLGIASHIGLWLDVPTIGCAKSVLVGRFEEPGIERGSWSPMLHRDEPIGAALRTQNKVQPVYVSPGHKSDIESAVNVLLTCDGGYRIPEPTRRAHLKVNQLRLAAS